jgi:hypothetical protein
MIEDSTEDGRAPSDDPPGAEPKPRSETGAGPTGERPRASVSNVARLHPPRIPHHPTLDRAVQGMIGAQLRSMYEHYIEQPIPDRLLELVQRLGDEARGDNRDGAPDQDGEER